MKKIAVVIPACNEEDHIAECIMSIELAYAQLKSTLLPSEVPQLKCIVVLDGCEDRTSLVLQDFQVDVLTCDFRCVGESRHLGIQYAIESDCDWICCTDADSKVDRNWFIQMMQHQPTDMICGVVVIDDWQQISQKTQQDYLAHYQDRMGHRHIHGANLCFKAELYLRLGGFKPMRCHEDVDFVERAEQLDYTITWSNRIRVVTSSRLYSRVEEGFAEFLRVLEQQPGA